MASVLTLTSLSTPTLGAGGGTVSLSLSSGTTGLSSISDTTAAGTLTAVTDGDYLLGLNAAGTYVRKVAKSAFQPADADLTAIAALTGPGGLRRSTINTWTLAPVVAGVSVDNSQGLVASVIYSPQWDSYNYIISIDDPAEMRTTIGVDTVGTGLFVQTVANGTVTIYAYAPFAMTLGTLRQVKTASGSVTVAISKNGTPITGWASIAVTTTPQDVTPTGATIAAGDRITLTFSSASSATGFEGTLVGVRA